MYNGSIKCNHIQGEYTKTQIDKHLANSIQLKKALLSMFVQLFASEVVKGKSSKHTYIL